MGTYPQQKSQDEKTHCLLLSHLSSRNPHRFPPLPVILFLWLFGKWICCKIWISLFRLGVFWPWNSVNKANWIQSSSSVDFCKRAADDIVMRGRRKASRVINMMSAQASVVFISPPYSFSPCSFLVSYLLYLSSSQHKKTTRIHMPWWQFNGISLPTFNPPKLLDSIALCKGANELSGTTQQFTVVMMVRWGCAWAQLVSQTPFAYCFLPL